MIRQGKRPVLQLCGAGQVASSAITATRQTHLLCTAAVEHNVVVYSWKRRLPRQIARLS